MHVYIFVFIFLSCKSAKVSCVSVKESYVSAKEPYVSAKEPYVSAIEPYVWKRVLYLNLQRCPAYPSKGPMYLQKSPICRPASANERSPCAVPHLLDWYANGPYVFETKPTVLHHTATHYSTLQHTPTHCNTLQHTIAHCNTIQDWSGVYHITPLIIYTKEACHTYEWFMSHKWVIRVKRVRISHVTHVLIGFLCRHTASNSNVSETYTSGAQ